MRDNVTGHRDLLQWASLFIRARCAWTRGGYWRLRVDARSEREARYDSGGKRHPGTFSVYHVTP